MAHTHCMGQRQGQGQGTGCTVHIAMREWERENITLVCLHVLETAQFQPRAFVVSVMCD